MFRKNACVCMFVSGKFLYIIILSSKDRMSIVLCSASNRRTLCIFILNKGKMKTKRQEEERKKKRL